MKISIDGQEFEVESRGDAIIVDGQPYTFRVVRHGDIRTVYVNERPFQVQLPPGGEMPAQVLVDAKFYQVELKGRAAVAAAAPRPAAARPRPTAVGAGTITAQMTGRVVKVNVSVGDQVQAGDVLLVIEAMKMENEITAPQAGKVKEIAVSPGARINEGDLLLVLDVGE